MRTLKKSLCLVLALIFVLGLCTIGSNAAFAKYTDIDKVTYEEAVDVLSGLGVIEGYPDGSFNPTANVTRAEAAAMIARMMLGREKADRLPVGDVKFTDVPETNWAAKYIAFCANRGIIVGMGDGTFRPAENITGTQMATMLLRALGYGVMGEYEGKGWDINAVADALYYKVFEDSKVVDFSEPATREETALYCWNTMWIQLVGYDVDLNYYSGRTYRTEYVVDGRRYTDYEPLTFAKEGFNLVKWDYAQVIANQATGEDYTVVRLRTGFVPAKDEDGKEIKGKVEPVYQWIYLNTETGLDLIGHEVTLYFKDDIKEDKVNHLDYYDVFFIRDESTVLSAYLSFSSYDDLYRALKAANRDNTKTKFADVNSWYNYDYETEAPINYGLGMYDWDSSEWYKTVEDIKGQKSTMDSLAWYTMLGTAYGTWILDHEGKVLVVLRNSYKVGQVKAVDNDHEEVQVHVWQGPSVGKYEDEYFDMVKGDKKLVYDGIAKNDYVVVQPVGSLTYIKATGTQTLDISERASSMDLLTFVPYWSFNGSMNADTYGLGIAIEDQDDPADVGVGDEVKFYTITGDFGTVTYFGLEILEKAKSAGIVYVNYKLKAISVDDWDWLKDDEFEDKNSGKITSAYKVQCVDQEGNEVVYKVKKEDDFNALQKGVYEVFVRGKYATFKAVEDSALTKTAGRNSYLKDEDNDNIYYVTSDTKVIYITGEGSDLDVTVSNKLTDKDPAEDYTVYVVAKKSGGNYKLRTVWVDSGLEAPEDYAESYMYIKGSWDKVEKEYLCKPSGYKSYDEDEVPYYTVYIDGVRTSKTMLTTTTKYADCFIDEAVIEGFYKYNVDEDGVYEIAPVDADKYVEARVTLTKGMIDRDGSRYYLYAENSDGIALTVDVLDVSAGTTTGTKTDAAVNSLERLYELLIEDYEFEVSYMYTMSANGKNEIPTGVMYVLSVEAPED